jgi:GNAT superfamily N-acetyltransferase
MRIRIRRGHYLDAPWLVRQSAMFAQEHGQQDLLPSNPDEAGAKWLDAIENHVVLVALAGPLKQRAGFIFGWAARHPFNDAVCTLTSALWWVEPAYRKTRVGAALIEEFITYGEELDYDIYITLRSRTGDGFLRRRGFKPDELVYRRRA